MLKQHRIMNLRFVEFGIVTTRYFGPPTSNFGPPSGISDSRPRYVPTGVGPLSGSRIAPSSPVPPVCARMRRDSGRFPRSAVLDPEKPRENHGVKPTHSSLVDRKNHGKTTVRNPPTPVPRLSVTDHSATVRKSCLL